MCGILGFVGARVDQSVFRQALSRLRHRGPDAEEIWAGEEALLGHTRLSIIDLSPLAGQPMTLDDRYVITYNGELYNYLELRNDLRKKGVLFKTESDTEVFLRAYIEWGPDALLKFNGMWAVAVWDKTARTLFMARDRLGKKPLFYSRTQSGFVFASEMKAIYPFLDQVKANRQMISKAVNDVFSYEATDDCLIENIVRFPAGHCGFFRDGSIRLQRYWDQLGHLIEVPASFPDQCEMFRELFEDACRIRLRSDVATGTALSGGLDSSVTLATINSLLHTNSKNGKIGSGKSHKAFIASFPGSVTDERQYAEQVAGALDVQAEIIEVDAAKEIENLYYYTYLFEELYLTSPIPFIKLYARMRQAGVTVTVDGHGADELFAGYPFDIRVLLAGALPNLAAWKRVADTLRHISGGVDRNYLRYLGGQLMQTFREMRSGERHARVDGLDTLNSRLYHSTYHTILPTLLRNYDRYSMANGVEIRMPFLDHRILSFAFSIGHRSKVRGGFSKYIVRESFRKSLPQAIVDRKVKVGWNTPFDQWMQGPIRQWLLDEIHSQAFNEATLIHPGEVRGFIMKAIKDNSGYTAGMDAWKMFMPYAWERSLQCADQPPAPMRIGQEPSQGSTL